MGRRRQKSNYVNNLISKIMLVWLITASIVVMLSFSKYETSKIIESSAKVAQPIMNLSSENSELTIYIDPTQNEKEYTFKVENTENEKKSEVSMEYILKLQTFNNLPLEFELYKSSDINKENNLLTDNTTVTEILNCEEEAHNYKLKIRWTNNESSYLYSHTIDYVQIILECEQID